MDVTIDHSHYSAEDLYRWCKRNAQLHCAPRITQTLQESREKLEALLQRENKAYYGINTGFGSLCNVQISPQQLHILQHNLLLSHACGLGEPVPEEISRLMLLLKIIGLRNGYSGIRPLIIHKLIELFNKGITPVVYEYGSLGASGDLAPLAHLCLPLIGKGEIWIDGQVRPFQAHHVDFQPIELRAKEGLALLNGTQFTLALAVASLIESYKILEVAIMTAALSIEAYQCDVSFLDPLIHIIRPHEGQKWVAQRLRHWLDQSDLPTRLRYSVQDPYSFRCVPQVLGPAYDTWRHCEKIIHTEINSVTDNPIFDPHNGRILSGGNFHAQNLGIALDSLAIALSEVANISERRTFTLLSGQRDLPEYLTPNAGLESGLMIAQYSAAALVRQLKWMAHPATNDSIVSSNGQEDHVSMAAHAGLKLYKMLPLLRSTIAIEWMCAAQALHFRHAQLSTHLKEHVHHYREIIPPLQHDRILHDDVLKTVQFLFR